MGSLSNAYELVNLQAIFGTGHYSGFPNTFHLALFEVMPTDSTFGTEVEVPGTNGYARESIANDDTNWDTTVVPVTNLVQYDFPTVITADWGITVGWALMDHASTQAVANIVCYGTWATPKTCQVGETPFVPVGGLTIGSD